MVSPTIQPTTPASVYIRWSSEAQTGRDSLRRQLEAAQHYAAENRLVIVETIIDEAVSAFSGHHLTKGRLGEFIRRRPAWRSGQAGLVVPLLAWAHS
jgi:hypothetical protein